MCTYYHWIIIQIQWPHCTHNAIAADKFIYRGTCWNSVVSFVQPRNKALFLTFLVEILDWRFLRGFHVRVEAMWRDFKSVHFYKREEKQAFHEKLTAFIHIMCCNSVTHFFLILTKWTNTVVINKWTYSVVINKPGNLVHTMTQTFNTDWDYRPRTTQKVV